MEMIPLYLHAPYKKYLSYFSNRRSNSTLEILELCCGIGTFSFDIAEITQGNLLAFDTSPESIKFCQKHVRENNLHKCKFEVADVETLQLPEQHFDIICVSGSLCYLNIELLLKNIKAWLKPNGRFIVVDTYGYSPIFNFKRKLNRWLFNSRSQVILKGIPKRPTIEAIRNRFQNVEVNFYGTFAFMGPFLKYILGENLTAKLVDGLDKLFPFLNRYAFKVVLCASG